MDYQSKINNEGTLLDSNSDNLSLTKTCKQCGVNFVIEKEDLEFYDKMSPEFSGKKYQIPAPTLCPEDRSRNRLAFRNLRDIHMRKCDATGEKILSHFTENVSFPVYKTDYWWGDGWDGTKYGRDFDFDRSFFDQFAELYKVAPQISRSEHTNENCDYCNGLSNCKDCYLSFNVDYCEDCLYITDGLHSKTCVDCFGIGNSELCFECVRCDKCYNVNYSLRSTNCSDSYFLSDCRGCKNCIGCCNLVNAEYFIFNKKSTKEEFEKIKKNLENFDQIEEMRQKFLKFQLNYPKKYYYSHSNENFSGDDIRHVKNSYNVFEGDNLENCKNCYYLYNAKDCQDYDIYGNNSEWIYNCFATGSNVYHNAFCMHNWNGSKNNYYCNLISGCQDCFGCASLKHKQYCILNRQYTKEEYERLIPKIIEKMKADGEWGEFFPVSMSVFAFNKTLAQENWPLTKEEIEKRGWKYEEPTDDIPHVEKVIEDPDSLPKTISEVTEDVLNWAIKCKKSKRPFLIQPRELAFYKEQGIPLPHFHPEIRHQKRLELKNPYKLFDRKCDNCGVDIKTSFAPNRTEKVFCEKCYQRSII